MTIEQICKIGRVAKENIQIIENFKESITAWLSSDEFRQNYANKPYPPLVNPKKVEYKKGSAEVAWTLNLPLPKYYDFVIFGAHACGFHAAIPGFLMLCGAQGRSMVIRKNNADDEKGYKHNYMRIHDELIDQRELQKKGKIDKIFLQITDFMIDRDCVKFHELVDASKALHVVKDPIEIMRSATETQMKIEQIAIEDDKHPVGLFLDSDYNKLLSSLLYYQGVSENWEDEKPSKPDINTMKDYMLDIQQHFHSALLFELLKNSLKVVKLKETKDFIGERAFDTMKELSEHFGLKGPKEEDRWLFERRVCNFKRLLPLDIFASDDMEVFCEGEPKKARNFVRGAKAYHHENVSKKYFENCAKLRLYTRFALQNIISDLNDISQNFELSDPEMRVFAHSGKDALKLLKNPKLLEKCKKYIKNLSQALLSQADTLLACRHSNTEALEYLKNNPQIALRLKALIQKDLSVLARVKPELIEGFASYQEFLKNCENITEDVKTNPEDEKIFTLWSIDKQLKYLDRK